MKIGSLAERTGTSVPAIRYYEEIGLLPRADRQAGGQRRYGDEDVKRLTFIRQCRTLGFPIDQVRALATLLQDDTRSCFEARELAARQLDAIESKLAELLHLQSEIAKFIATCDDTCVGGPGPSCVVLQDLSLKPIGAADPSSCGTCR
jgi:DNA-binding transcriptional MerR regulator